MKYLFFASFFFQCFLVSAQHAIGAQLGTQLSNLYGQQQFLFEMGGGFEGGLHYHYKKSNFTINAGIEYSKKGYNSAAFIVTGNQFGISDGYWKYRYQLISIPIHFGYQFGERILFSPQLGVNVSYLLSAKIHFPNPDVLAAEQFIQSCNPVWLSPSAGFEISYPLSRWELFCRFQGQFSTNTIFTDEASEFNNERIYSISNVFGCRFNLEQKKIPTQN